MRLGVNIFIALMISVVGGVTYQPIVEKPVSYYYDAEVTHTSHDYSYKPGQSGTEFFFFIKEGNDYRQLGIFEIFGISTVFYLFFITLIALIRKLITASIRKKDDSSRSGPVTIFIKRGGEQKKKSFIAPVIVLLIAGMFILSGHQGWWRVNNTFGGVGSTSHQFTTDQIIFTPDGKDGIIWAVDINKVDPASALREIEPDKASKVGFMVKTINPVTNEVTPIDSLSLSDENYSYKHYFNNGKLWLMARPTFMRVYNTADQSVLYEDIESFCENFSVLSSGIESYYLVVSEPDRLYLNTLDGSRYYYVFSNEDVVEKVDYRYKEKTSHFFLEAENGERSVLTIGKNKRNAKEVEGYYFTKGIIVYEDEQYCVIQHFSDITDEATFNLSVFSNEGKLLWDKHQKELPYHQPDNMIISSSPEVSCSRFNDNLFFVFNQGDESSGVCCIAIKSGKEIWSYTQSELNKVINNSKEKS